MSSHLCLTFRFPGGTFHGRRDEEHPEWPPSPLRVFQALVRAAADTRSLAEQRVTAALDWLAQQHPPTIVAPSARVGKPRRVAVPNNDGDLVLAAWARGRDPVKDPSQLKTLKPVRTCYMRDDDGVHYLWSVSGAASDVLSTHLPVLSTLATHVVALGWGIDLAIGHVGVIEPGGEAQIKGERWNAVADTAAGVPLRVPVDGTITALIARHQAFKERLANGAYTPPAALSAFRRVFYRRASDRPQLPVAAFALLKEDGSGYRPFDTATRGLTVAGLVRGATRAAAEKAGWNGAHVAAFVLGHGAGDGPDRHVPAGPRRFAYVPLPSLEHRGPDRPAVVGSIRRVLVCGAAYDTGDEVAWARRALSGRDLVDHHTGEIVALMSVIPPSDSTVRNYLRPASEWTTVTPVVLPGYDDPNHYRRRINQETDGAVRRRLIEKHEARIDGLLRKSLVQAGWPEELAAHAELEWRSGGFLPGVQFATRYGVPNHLRTYPRLHVRLRWRNVQGDPINLPGPVCIGTGRFYGLGLFARG